VGGVLDLKIILLAADRFLNILIIIKWKNG
jgi:hypothetical protein